MSYSWMGTGTRFVQITWSQSVKIGDLVETYEFGVGLLVEIMFNNYRVLYPSGKWYWTTKPDLELISEAR